MYRIGQEEAEAVKRVIEKGQLFRYNDGYREVENFEKEWAPKIGTKYALAVSGGTAALIVSLAGLNIGPGDEVIVPGYTFMATALAVLAVGAVPVIAEIDESMTIDPDDIVRKISPNTKAVLPVHMMGFPSDMDRIMALKSKYSFAVVEDSCQADGGSYKGRRLGSIGDVGAFSFNDFKIITCGEGGAITTDNRELYERASIYHDGGTAFRGHANEFTVPIFCGSQFRSNEISGAILRVQLSRLDGILEDLRRIKKVFLKELVLIKGLKFIKSNDIEGDCGTTVGLIFETHKQAIDFAKHTQAAMPFNSDKHLYWNWTPILEKRGSFHPLLNPYYSEYNKDRNTNYSPDMCPKTRDIIERTVYIGLHPDMTEEAIYRKIQLCREAAQIL